MEFFTRAYKNYANFSGRDTRQQYWMFYLFYIIFAFVAGFVDALIGTDGLLGTIFILVTIIPSIAIATRRLHDIGKSGWWQLLVFIPIIGAIVLIVFLATKGSFGENQYGPNPVDDMYKEIQ
jgi:uncharacterized membrane protein YhaH (DUF805 family)